MSIAFNSLRNILFRSLTVVFLLLVGLLTARQLGTEGRGLYALVTLYSALGVAMLGGMGQAASRMISNQGRRLPEVVANAVMLALLTGVGALMVCLAAYWFAGIFGDGRPVWLVIVGASQPALLVGSALTWAFLGADDHRRYSLAILTPSLFTLLFTFPILLTFPGSTQGALVAWLAAQYLVVGWLLWLGRQVWLPLPLSLVSPSSLSAMVSFSAMVGLANLVSYLNLRADTLFTDHYLGKGAVGVYSIAVQLVEGMYFISQAVGIALWARVGAAAPDDAAALVARSLRFTLALMAVAGLMLFAACGVAIPLLYGDAYGGAVAAFRWFVPGVAAWGMANIFATYFTNQLGQPRIPLLIAAIALAINVLLCPLLIPRFGLSGGAMATTISYIAAIAVEIALFSRRTGIPMWQTLVLTAEDRQQARRSMEPMIARLHPLIEPVLQRLRPAGSGEQGELHGMDIEAPARPPASGQVAGANVSVATAAATGAMTRVSAPPAALNAAPLPGQAGPPARTVSGGRRGSLLDLPPPTVAPRSPAAGRSRVLEPARNGVSSVAVAAPHAVTVPLFRRITSAEQEARLAHLGGEPAV